MENYEIMMEMYSASLGHVVLLHNAVFWVVMRVWRKAAI